jgi:hypothetical protein
MSLRPGVRKRHLTVGGLDDPRRAVFAVHARQEVARVDPERVVAAIGILVFEQVVVQIGGTVVRFDQALERIGFDERPRLPRASRPAW